MTPGELLRRARGSTEPSENAVASLIRRVELPGRALRSVAREPSSFALRRVTARLEPHPPRRSPGRWAWTTLGLASAGALALALYLLPSRFSSQQLHAEVPTSVQVSPEVAVRFSGSGSVDGARNEVLIRWDVGTIETDVEPNQGVHLAILTDEARIVVHGTAFSVTRTALGTSVSVSRGEVETTCGTESPRILRAAEHLDCLPIRAVGELARARELRASGATASVVLGALERGAALPDASSGVLGELLAMRIDVLVAADDDRLALEAAERYLAAGYTTRRPEVQAIAETLRQKVHGSFPRVDPSSLPESP